MRHFGYLKSSPDRNRRASLLYHMAVDSALLSALSSFSCLVSQHDLLLGWSWIMEIDYAATSQIPLPRAWPQSVWLQVGQACLRDALLAALEKGQQVRLPPQGHATCYHSKWEKITQTGRKEWRCSSQNTSPAITLQDFFLPCQLLVTTLHGLHQHDYGSNNRPFLPDFHSTSLT